MSKLAMPRRTMLAGLGASVLAPAVTRTAHAAGSLVAAIYPAAWEDAYVGVVKPAVKAKHNIDVNFASLYAVDQIAKLAASRGNPPFDVIVLDPGPRITAIERQVVERFDPSKLTNRGLVPPIFVDDWGIGVSAQMVGMGYNPKKMDAPKAWTDLLTAPYVGRLALVGFQTTFGTMSLMELNKQLGGSIENPEPVFKAIKEIAPKVGAVAAPATLAALYQQGQVDLIYHTYAEIAAMKSRGLDIEFAKPASGMPMFYNTLHLAKGAREVANAYQYIDTVIEKDVQAKLQAKPWNFLSVNKAVDLAVDFPPTVIKSHDELQSMITYEWAEINKYRTQWIERFNKTVAT
jgi:putative spermidine/putrescine transport system substrate-binding protein